MNPRLLTLVLGLTACGELAPEKPESKFNSSNANAQTSNANANNSTTSNNTTSNNTDNAMPGDLLSRYGTEGPSDVNPTSPGGNARCALEDVRTTDLEGSNDSAVGSDWSSVVSDTAARCGDDRETLAWRLMNCERIVNDLPPYECDLRMVWMGREHTLDMIARDYFSHDNPDGETPFDRMQRHGVGFRGTVVRTHRRCKPPRNTKAVKRMKRSPATPSRC